MKKISITIILLLILAATVYAETKEVNYTTNNMYRSASSTPHVKIQSLRYEPYPVNPGEYFTLWIKAENVGNEMTEDATFELLPEYPFSLDPNEKAIRTYGMLPVYEPVILEYKIRVDDNAVDGTNEIEIRYNTDGDDSHWQLQEFDIEVDDAQTDFDLVIQETTDSEVSIALANTGKNIAYSVIVRIPEQEGFQIIGTNGQMVGNLEDGDYTLVGFDINKKRGSDDNNLKVQIDYTDEIGERRSITKTTSLDGSSASTTTMINGMALPEGMTREEFIASRGRIQQQKVIYQEWWFWAIIIVILYTGLKSIKIIKRKKEENEEKKHRSKK